MKCNNNYAEKLKKKNKHILNKWTIVINVLKYNTKYMKHKTEWL